MDVRNFRTDNTVAKTQPSNDFMPAWPLLAKIPFQINGYKEIKIVNWQISCENQLESLSKMIRENRPHFITLQIMASPLAKLIEKIEAVLPHYACIHLQLAEIDENEKLIVHENKHVVCENNAVTFYNKNEFEPAIFFTDDIEHIKELAHEEFNGNVTRFREKNEELLSHFNIIISNTNQRDDIDLLTQERRIQTFLTQKDTAKLTENPNVPTLKIVCGHFNSIIAPLDDHEKIIASSIQQAKNGCFYRDKNHQINQAESFLLNSLTGKIYNKQELKFRARTVTENNYQQVISVANYYRTKKLINFQYTIFKYEEELRKKLNDQNIVVRVAKNVKNVSCLSVKINHDIFSYLQTLDLDLTLEEENKHYFMYAKNTHSMMLAMNMVWLRNKMTLLENKANIYQPIFTTLLSAIELEPNKKNPAFSVIIEHFNQLTDYLLKAKTIQIKKIAAIEISLKMDLYGKPPVSKKLNTALWATMGVIAGFTFGFAIGATLTFWSGSLGALPLAILFAAGTKSLIVGGLATSASTSLICGAAGFFSAAHAQQEHAKKHQAQNAALSKELIEETSNFKRFFPA